MAYTPGVARVCTEIAGDRAKAFEFTIKKNTVAVVTDGSAVLGLGDIGPEASMPVMEGKAMLFKEFAQVDAFPIALDTKDPDRIVDGRDAAGADLRRDQPRGHLRPPLLRDRGPAARGPRHPRLPRRPARHRRRGHGGALQRAEDRRQADRVAAGRDARPRSGRDRVHEDDGRRRGHRHHRLRPPGRDLDRARGLRGRRDAGDQALVRRDHQPGEDPGRSQRRPRGRRSVHRPLRARASSMPPRCRR